MADLLKVGENTYFDATKIVKMTYFPTSDQLKSAVINIELEGGSNVQAMGKTAEALLDNIEKANKVTTLTV